MGGQREEGKLGRGKMEDGKEGGVESKEIWERKGEETSWKYVKNVLEDEDEKRKLR